MRGVYPFCVIYFTVLYWLHGMNYCLETTGGRIMSTLKRLLAMLLCVCMVVGLVACGSAPAAGGDAKPQMSVTGGEPEPDNNVVQEPSEEEIEAPADSSVNTEPTQAVQTQPQTEEQGEESAQSGNTSTEKEPEEQKPEEQKPEEQKPEEQKPEEQKPEDNTPVEPNGDYNEGIVLVKVKESFKTEDLGTLAYTTAEPLYTGSKWYTVQLTDSSKTVEAVTYLAGLKTFAQVDYDYVMSTTDKESENPNYNQQTNLGLHNIPYGWTQNGKAPGGSPDVIVAVIDTGVDYNHMDLRNNIWINSAEIPDNGKDDDGNGYIDDVYGWDCVGNDNDPMDDNGHGTHVAGIIAAENNKVGGIGVAYNCKVMALKAGNSSGYFNNSDIAEAVQYAYMNGASVINMSFGGSQISIAVEEALENAYNTCVLVAAAGNDGACNNLACETCDIKKVCYPAALSYVIGVMSTDAHGSDISSFSNYDHYPYNSIEYEVFAVGEGVGSTWPSNKYACLNGTSMAAPTVSGIAALLRSSFSDREVYSTKFIQSQIVNTGTINPYNFVLQKTDNAHSVADVQEALTKLPKPAVKLYDYHIDDSVSISEKNNGNGIIDAGETVRLYISLHNRGGVASNVNVTIDTYRSEVGDETMTDPYFTFVNPAMELSDIGTYSVRESGDKYFEIVVDGNCPNDYLVNFNIRYTYKNGLDEKDKTVYEDDGQQQAQFNVSSGYHLPAVINEDTVYAADRLYIVGENVLIASGVTVTFEAGAQIQFYADQEYYNSPEIQVYGNLILGGTADNMVNVHPSERYPQFVCAIRQMSSESNVTIQYVDGTNLFPVDGTKGSSLVTDSILRNNGNNVYRFDRGRTYTADNMQVDNICDSYVDLTKWNSHVYSLGNVSGSFLRVVTRNALRVSIGGEFVNNILYVDDVGLTNDPYPVSFSGRVENNLFIASNNDNIQSLCELSFANKAVVLNNSFSVGYQENVAQVIPGYLDSNGNPTMDIFGTCSDLSALYPHVVSVEMFNADGEPITTIGKEEIKVRVTFNSPMSQSKQPTVTFGTIEPYADYKIDGQWVDEMVWEGTYTLKAQIENGQNFLKVKNACDANDPTKVVLGDYQLHEFTIDTTAAMAMSLFATATDHGIELTWAQDDYDTLMGYNIYRSTAKDGNFVKINPSVLTAGESSFVDTNAEPGVTYWYTFTVVLSDFSESAPAGKVYCTAVDTIMPTVYHTPVNQGYLNNNLVISCTASDNMKVASVTLYYRTAGAEQWKSLQMQKVNDKYSATVFGSELTLDGLEYYLVAADTSNTVNKGTAEEPYFVVIKDASTISRKGDVDGNGVVDTKDALMIVQCINGDLIMTDDEFKRADLNGDELLSSVEALRILQYINGNVPDLNM